MHLRHDGGAVRKCCQVNAPAAAPALFSRVSSESQGNAYKRSDDPISEPVILLILFHLLAESFSKTKTSPWLKPVTKPSANMAPTATMSPTAAKPRSRQAGE